MAVALRWSSFPRYINKISDLHKQNRFEIIRFCTEIRNHEKSEPKGGNFVSKNAPETIDGFRVLRLYPDTSPPKKEKKRPKEIPPPRTQKMTPEQDWTSVWPGPRTFHPASVPLPLHQGCNKHGPPPDKTANTELMKIPNFLHLTPPTIKKHCDALKKFCTDWPEELVDDETIEKHFPIEIITSDYCHASRSIRDPKSRIVCLRFKLKNLEFDSHSKDKFLRLVGARYDPKTDYVTITTDSCPLKKQNYDYAHYLLTALYFESWKHEEWEKNKSREDMEVYRFSGSVAFENIKAYFDYNNRELPPLKKHGKALETWFDDRDTKENIQNYKESALEILSLPPFETKS